MGILHHPHMLRIFNIPRIVKDQLLIIRAGHAAPEHEVPLSTSFNDYAFSLRIGILMLWILLALGALPPAFVIGVTYAGWRMGPNSIVILLFLIGAYVAGVLALAGFLEGKDQQHVISPLYAADLIGGALGACAASLVLVPALGFLGAAGIVLLLVCVGLPLLWSQ